MLDKYALGYYMFPYLRKARRTMNQYMCVTYILVLFASPTQVNKSPFWYVLLCLDEYTVL